MMHLAKKTVALGMAVSAIAFARQCFAQDDLDDLLKDLESESTTVAEKAPEQTDEAAGQADALLSGAEAPAEEVVSAAEEPAAEEPAAEEVAEEEPAEVAEVAEEPAAEEPAEVAEVAEEPDAEEVAEEEPAEVAEVAEEEPAEVAEVAEEEPAEVADVAEEPAAEDTSLDSLLDEVAEVAEEPAAEEPAEVAEVAEEPAAEEPAEVAEVAEEPAEEPAAEEPAEVADVAEEPAAEEPAAEEPAPVVAKPAPAKKPSYSKEDAELIANIQATEKLRREAYDLQARREIQAARKSMENGEYIEATRHYAAAKKLLNDSPSTAGYRKECDQGIANSRYYAAIQEWNIGRREKAKKYMQQAIDFHHPSARAQLAAWNKEDDPDKNKLDISEVASRRNDQDYKDLRKKNLQHLKRSRQLLGTRELDRALDECELVLVSDPYNQAAIRLRETIQKKRHTILMQERRAAREGMMADVDKAWRPVYAVDAREIENSSSQTLKREVSDDPTLAMEQTIIKRMKEMRLPSISFKPPATIIDAIDFFRSASKDFDRPDIPLEQRGFNFVLKTPETLRATQQVEETDQEGFGGGDEEDSSAGGQAGVPVIPTITASDITFYDALKLVCEAVDYKFKVQGPIVMVMQKDMSTAEMVTRSYPVVSAFMERMGTASSDMKEMKSAGFGGGSSRRNDNDGEENQERDWKEFFSLLGVQWPEGSSIMYIKTIGKLRVRNTYENLAELEKALTEMNADPKLIEIETRFVEVCQEDLNSLGFEWILNSDYSIGLGKHLSRALGLRSGKWGTESGSTTVSSTYTESYDTLSQNGAATSQLNTISDVSSKSTTRNSTTYRGGAGNRWSRNYGSHGSKSLGLNAFGGSSDYQSGMRYLSTDSNHISGEGYSTNDQFMRVNAFLGSADLSMILHMLSQRSDTDLLSAPKVLTKPGEEAVIKVVTEYIYPTDYDVQLQSSSSSSSSSSGGSQSAILAVVEPQSFTMREVGVILDVTPTLTDDGNLIDLELNTQVVDEPTWKNYGMRIPFTGNSSLQSFEGIGDILTGLSEVLGTIGTGLSETVKAAFAESAVNSASSALESLTANSSENITYYDAPMEQPFFHVRSIVSKVSVFPGATIVMGGLITEQRKAMDDKIPFLGDLPLIGRFFRSHSEQTSKRNLLIFVTTRLVDVHGREVAMGETEQKDEDVKSVEETEE